MKKNLIKLTISIFMVLFSTGYACAAFLRAEDKFLGKIKILSRHRADRHEKGEKDAFIILLSDVNAAMEIAGVSGGEYAAKTARELQFDALRLGPWFVHFGVREESLFDPSPSQFDNKLQYIAVGYELANGRISAFWDHTCNNPSRKLPDDKRSGIHWNELGIGYESTEMRIGHKNDDIRFNSGSEWLNVAYWQASLSRIWMRTENDYEWMVKLAARDDVFRAGRQVIYIQFALDSIYDVRGVNFTTGIEVGDRISLTESAYLTAFVSYTDFHDWYSFGQGDFHHLGPGEDFISVGMSLEIGLDRAKSNHGSNPINSKGSWAPGFEITGGYTYIIDNEGYGHSSDLSFDLELWQLYPKKTLYLNTYAGILTLPDDLNPHVVKYGIGPSLTIKFDTWGLRALYSYTSLYGLEHTGVIRKYHLLGLELTTNNASPWNAGMGAGVYPSTTNFDYGGNVHGNLGYHLDLNGLSPYLEVSGTVLQGSSSKLGHAIETGIQIQGKTGRFSIYFRLQDDFDVFRFGQGRQTLLGIRLTF